MRSERTHLIFVVIPVSCFVIGEEFFEHASDELAGGVDCDVGGGVDVDSLVADLGGGGTRVRLELEGAGAKWIGVGGKQLDVGYGRNN